MSDRFASLPHIVRMRTTSGRRGFARPLILFAVVLLVFVLLFAAGFIPGRKREAKARDVAKENADAAPMVATYKLGDRAKNSEVELPGNIQPLSEAPIFARTSGYLQRRLVDIGDRVTSGQLLAQIESPETNQELRQAGANSLQARAAQIQAQSKLDLAQVTYARQKTLAQQRAISQQDADTAAANLAVAQADLEAAKATFAARQAEVARLAELTGYQQIKAPFAGIITARNVDEGSLINAATGGVAGVAGGGAGGSGTASGNSASGRELFRLSDPSRLRVYVNVPQRYAPFIHAKQDAEVRVQELSAKPYIGTVARTAGAVDPASRTMVAEVQLPNPGGVLLAGMYAQVRFRFANKEQPLLIPSNSLVVRPDGLRVAVVGADKKVSLRKAQVGRDYGQEIELLSGAQEGESIITTPPDELTDGMPVELAVDGNAADGAPKS